MTQVTQGVTDAGPVAAAAQDEVDYSTYDLPGADESDDVRSRPVVSTSEEVANAETFFERAKASETRAQNERAHKQSSVHTLMQYRHHPETGEVMLTQEQIDEGLASLHARGRGIEMFAYIWHQDCRTFDADEDTGEPVCTGLKAEHVHIVILHKERLTLRSVSDAFKIPSARVRGSKEASKERGFDEHGGRAAARRTFFDHAQYLTHETSRKTGIPGVHQPDRTYWPELQNGVAGGKYQYGRDRVTSNFDFGAALDEHMAVRATKSQASAGGGLRERRERLRDLAMDGAPLDQLKALDRQMYADDLRKLKELVKDYREELGAEKAAEVGPVRRKSFVLAAGSSRNGKDVFLQAVAREFLRFGTLAGEMWRVVKPAARNSAEGLDLAEVAHHEDGRFTMFPGYAEALTYFDPNEAVAIAARHYNQLPAVQRLTLVSTSEPLESFALTMRARKPSEVLAHEAAQARKASRRSYANDGTIDPDPLALDVTEFLLRIGWYVEVHSPVLARDDMTDEEFAQFRANMIMNVFRVADTGVTKTHTARSREGSLVGHLKSRHELKYVAGIKGCDEAAVFVASMILRERNKDVVELIPDEAMSEIIESQVSVETRVAEDAARSAKEAAEFQRREQIRHHREAILAFAEEAEANARRAAQKEQAEREREARRDACKCASNHKAAASYSYNPPSFTVHNDLACPLLVGEDRARVRADVEKRMRGHLMIPDPALSFAETLRIARKGK